MEQTEKMSVRAYARTLKVSEGAIRKAIKNGLITNGYDPTEKKIIPAIADQEWGFLHKVVKARGGVNLLKAIQKLETIQHMDPPQTTVKEAKGPDTSTARTSLSDLIASLNITGDIPASEALRIREIIGAGLDMIKLEEAAGKLVPRDKVEKALFALGSELKKALFNMPQRIVRDMLAAPSEVEAINIMSDELTYILTTFGNLKQDTLN